MIFLDFYRFLEKI